MRSESDVVRFCDQEQSRSCRPATIFAIVCKSISTRAFAILDMLSSVLLSTHAIWYR